MMRGLAACGVLVLLACLGGRARAQSPALQISPISVLLQPGQMATTLSVSNGGDAPTTVQLRPFRWDQDNHEDHLAPTDDLVVSPPIVQIDPGQTQIFRLILQRPPAGSEDSYRLLVDQLPPAAAAGTVRMALRVSLPVFAAAPEDTPPDLAWRVMRDASGLVVAARNGGGRHVRVVDPRLFIGRDAARPLQSSQNPYVLPGMERHWRLTLPAVVPAGARLRLAARTDAGTIDADLGVAP